MGRMLMYGCALFAVLIFDALARGPHDTPVAIRGARVLAMEGDVIEKGTMVIRGTKIEALGADVSVPAGATIASCHDRRGSDLEDR
jgi:hypothetical protein